MHVYMYACLHVSLGLHAPTGVHVPQSPPPSPTPLRLPHLFISPPLRVCTLLTGDDPWARRALHLITIALPLLQASKNTVTKPATRARHVEHATRPLRAAPRRTRTTKAHPTVQLSPLPKFNTQWCGVFCFRHGMDRPEIHMLADASLYCSGGSDPNLFPGFF